MASADKTTRMSDDLSRVRVSAATGGGRVSTSRPKARRAGKRAESGQALVEFALVLPILMLLIVGIIKGGLLYNNYLQLTDSVRTGARVLAIERGQGGPCGAAANQVISAAGGLTGSNISMSMTEYPEGPLDAPNLVYTPSAYPPPPTDTCPFTLTSGSAVTITASYPCDLTIMGVNFVPGGCHVTATATERVE